MDDDIVSIKYGGSCLITTGYNGKDSKISCWHPSTGALNWESKFDSKVQHLSINSQGETSSTVTLILEDKKIINLDINNGKVISKLDANLPLLKK